MKNIVPNNIGEAIFTIKKYCESFQDCEGCHSTQLNVTGAFLNLALLTIAGSILKGKYYTC